MKTNVNNQKSTTMKSIADKLGLDFYDIRLSVVDKTDIEFSPKFEEVHNVDETGKD